MGEGNSHVKVMEMLTLSETKICNFHPYARQQASPSPLYGSPHPPRVGLCNWNVPFDKVEFLKLQTRMSVKWNAPLDKNPLLPCSSLGKNLLH